MQPEFINWVIMLILTRFRFWYVSLYDYYGTIYLLPYSFSCIDQQFYHQVYQISTKYQYSIWSTNHLVNIFDMNSQFWSVACWELDIVNEIWSAQMLWCMPIAYAEFVDMETLISITYNAQRVYCLLMEEGGLMHA